MTPSYKLTQWNSQLLLKQSMQQENRRLRSLLDQQMNQLNKDSQLTKQRYLEAQRNLKALADRMDKMAINHPPTAPSSSDGLIDALQTQQTSTLVSVHRPVVDTKTSLQPIIEALAVQDRKIQAMASKVAGNEVKAPVSGMITAVHHPVGTYVPSGEPIVTIASDQGQYIVAYVDQASSHEIQPGDDVSVVVRDRRLRASAKVLRRGSQYEPLPSHLRDAPEVLQFGLPLQVSVPTELGLLPGEIVEIVF